MKKLLFILIISTSYIMASHEDETFLWSKSFGKHLCFPDKNEIDLAISNLKCSLKICESYIHLLTDKNFPKNIDYKEIGSYIEVNNSLIKNKSDESKDEKKHNGNSSSSSSTNSDKYLTYHKGLVATYASRNDTAYLQDLNGIKDNIQAQINNLEEKRRLLISSCRQILNKQVAKDDIQKVVADLIQYSKDLNFTDQNRVILETILSSKDNKICDYVENKKDTFEPSYVFNIPVAKCSKEESGYHAIFNALIISKYLLSDYSSKLKFWVTNLEIRNKWLNEFIYVKEAKFKTEMLRNNLSNKLKPANPVKIPRQSISRAISDLLPKISENLILNDLQRKIISKTDIINEFQKFKYVTAKIESPITEQILKDYFFDFEDINIGEMQNNNQSNLNLDQDLKFCIKYFRAKQIFTKIQADLVLSKGSDIFNNSTIKYPKGSVIEPFVVNLESDEYLTKLKDFLIKPDNTNFNLGESLLGKDSDNKSDENVFVFNKPYVVEFQEIINLVQNDHADGIRSIILKLPDRWITVVINKPADKNVQFLVADPTGENQIYHDRVRALIKILSGKDYHKPSVSSESNSSYCILM